MATWRGRELEIISFIIGLVNFVGSLVIVILLVFNIVELSGVWQKLTGYKDEDNIGNSLLVLCVLLITVVVDLGFVAGLLFGLHKLKPTYLKGYMLYSLFFATIFFITFAVTSLIIKIMTVDVVLFYAFPIVLVMCFAATIRVRYNLMEQTSREPATAVYYTT